MHFMQAARVLICSLTTNIFCYSVHVGDCVRYVFATREPASLTALGRPPRPCDELWDDLGLPPLASASAREQEKGGGNGV